MNKSGRYRDRSGSPVDAATEEKHRAAVAAEMQAFEADCRKQQDAAAGSDEPDVTDEMRKAQIALSEENMAFDRDGRRSSAACKGNSGETEHR